MKFLKVNMKDQTIVTEDVPEKYLGLGGRGLTSIMINEEVPPTCDPLGAENKLIFAPGFLSGTKLVNTARISVGAKSPLTGGIKESNAGGTIGTYMGRLGITAVIVEDKAPDGETYNLTIDGDGNAALVSANEYKGLRTYAFAEKMLAKYGEKTSILCIGPAGEMQLSSASVQSTDVDGRPCRAAARGGMGAVMGAKGLKALILDQGGKNADPLADKDAFNAAAKEFAKAIQGQPFCSELLPALGTAGLVGIVNSMGSFPAYNATKGVLEGWEKVSGEAYAEIMTEREGGNPTHLGCTACVIRCSNEFVDKSGKFVTSSLEYESIWSLGGMTGITDPEIVAQLDRLCDDIGLDTMNVGCAIGVAMDAGYKPFGDGQAAIDMMEEIASGTEVGIALGNSPDAVGKHFNHTRIPTVKQQSIAAYDPRGMQGNGVTYATSPMGADHTAGNVIGEYLAGNLDPVKPEGQMEASRNTQIAMAAVDCIGICLLASFALNDPAGAEALGKAITAKTGVQGSPDDVPALGIRILKAEVEFNRKAGLTAADDRLPQFFKEEPIGPNNVVFQVTDEDLDKTLVFD